MTKRKQRFVMLRWTDAHDIGAAEWLNPDDLDGSHFEVISCGWLLKKSRTNYVISHSVDENGQARGAFSVPRQNVVEYRRLH